MKAARDQQDEIDATEHEAGQPAAAGYHGVLAAAMPVIHHGSDSDDDEGSLSEGSVWEGDDFDEEVAAEDEAALAAFMSADAKNYQQKTLSDMILDKIKQKQTEAGITETPRCV